MMQQRESQIDQDFNKLMDRYNRSKVLIDSLYGGSKTNGKEDFPLQQKPPYQNKLKRETPIKLKSEPSERGSRIGSGSAIGSGLGGGSKRNIQLRDNNSVQKKYSSQSVRGLNDFEEQNQNQFLQHELQRVQMLCDELNIEIQEVERLNISLKNQNEALNEDIRQADRRKASLEQSVSEYKLITQTLENQLEKEKEDNRLFIMRVEQLEKKIEEQKDLIQTLDSRNSKLKEKYDSEKLLLMQEKEEKVTCKKDKLKQLKSQISDLEARNANYEKELFKLTKSFDIEKENSQKLQNQISQLIEQQDESTREHKQQQDKYKILLGDYDHLKTLLYQNEEKLKLELEYKVKDQQSNKHIHKELDELSDENLRLKNIIYDLQTQLSVVDRQHEEEMVQIERKIDGLVRQIQTLRDENNEWRLKFHEQKKTLQQTDEKFNNTRQKYIKHKQLNRQLELQVKSIEEKVKQYERERNYEDRELLIKTQKQSVETRSNKVRVLDDIQNMIKQHKKLLSE